LLAVLLVPGAARAGEPTRQRQLCRQYLCTTVAQDRSVRIVRVKSRHPEEQSEEESPPSVHWAVWKPSGRTWPLKDPVLFLDSIKLRLLALGGSWVAFATEGCSHETLSCGEGVTRLNAHTGRREEPLGAGPGQWLPGEWECFGGETPKALGISDLVIAASGTMGWIEEGHLCELPPSSQRPVLLASSPSVLAHSLELADGFFIWREGEALRSARAA
jgi:hypothetical protein